MVELNAAKIERKLGDFNSHNSMVVCGVEEGGGGRNEEEEDLKGARFSHDVARWATPKRKVGARRI